MHVLIVEDDESLRASLAQALRGEGFRVDEAMDGEGALAILASWTPDVVVLDRDLPGRSGDEVCRAMVAARNPAKVLMLTAAGGLADRVAGLELGADDYLAKPFAYIELLARLRALVRRDAGGVEPVLVTAGDVVIDLTRRLVTRGGLPLRLTPKEFGVLEHLARADGGFVSVDRLLYHVWDDPHERTRGVVKVTVYSLRQKLGLPSPVEFQAGHGYRMVRR